MPVINNIGNVNNLDSKRVQSKLSFQVGEVFQGKVVSAASQGNEVVLKTTDGWQFTANTQIPLDNLPQGLVKFKVVGYEDGKLQVVIVPEEANGASIEEKSIETILRQQNLPSSKADLKVLISMVNHGIPLTKENISDVKTIIDFKEKISSNIEEEDTFINKYLQSKGIDVNSAEGKNINQLLKDFFSELKNASVEDLVTLKENGIDITEDNLKSFNKVFKEDTGLYKQITQSMNKETLTSGSSINSEINNELKPVTKENDLKIDTLASKNGENAKKFLDAVIEDEGIKNNLTLDEKTMVSNSEEQEQNNFTTGDSAVKTIIDLKGEILSQPKNETELIKQYFSNKNISEDSEKGKVLSNSIKEFLETMKSVSKDTQEPNVTQDISEKDTPIAKENISVPNTIVPSKENSLLQPKNETELIKQYLSNKNISEDSEKGKVLSNNIKEFLETIKPASKDIQEPNITQNISEKDTSISKENVSIAQTITDLKEEILGYPKSEGEVIKQYLNSKNIPEDSDKGKELNNSIKEFFDTIKKGPVNEVLSKFQASTVEKSEVSTERNFSEQFKEDLPVFKEIIKSIVTSNEVVKNMGIPKVNQIAENIKSEIAQKTDFMKDIIKGMRDGDWSLIKSSINDIKVFNTVSNQYYYMDVPVNVNQRQYECKLLIKDDRKKGKKIDSKNVKMFVSVKTINMGKVDAYIKVSDRNVSIDLKCNESFIKVFENENYKLVSTLKDMNYNVKLNIESQAYEANIVTTREFFQDNAIGSINVMV